MFLINLVSESVLAASKTDYVFVEKGDFAGTFGIGSSNRSFYYYVDGELALCGDAESGFSVNNKNSVFSPEYDPDNFMKYYSRYSYLLPTYEKRDPLGDPIVRSILLVATGKVPGYTINLPKSSFPRTSEYAMYHSILSCYLHGHAGITGEGNIGWWDYSDYDTKYEKIIGEAEEIYYYVREKYPDILAQHSLYYTGSPIYNHYWHTKKATEEQIIYFLREDNKTTDIKFSSTSSVSASVGAETIVDGIKTVTLPKNTDTVNLTFNHSISPGTFGTNNAKYTNAIFSENNKTTKTAEIKNGDTTYADIISVSVGVGEKKRFCETVFYTPSEITIKEETGEFVRSSEKSLNSSICIDIISGKDATDIFIPNTEIDD